MENKWAAHYNNMVNNVMIVKEKMDEAIKEKIALHKEFNRKHKHDINKEFQ